MLKCLKLFFKTRILFSWDQRCSEFGLDHNSLEIGEIMETTRPTLPRSTRPSYKPLQDSVLRQAAQSEQVAVSS